MFKLLVLAILVFFIGPAASQNRPGVQSQGVITPGNCAKFSAPDANGNQFLVDAGPCGASTITMGTTVIGAKPGQLLTVDMNNKLAAFDSGLGMNVSLAQTMSGTTVTAYTATVNAVVALPAKSISISDNGTVKATCPSSPCNATFTWQVTGTPHTILAQATLSDNRIIGNQIQYPQ